MRINNNIMAMNAHRNLGVNTTRQTKSLEKLSSGLRVNRAADDAAGLSVSEKMRAQIKGMKQGARNAQDGISFIQTAEGAMDEVSAMLTRLKELSVQKASETYSTDDIAAITSEAGQLIGQITEIIDNTKFNGINISSEVDIAAGDEDGDIITVGVDMSGAAAKSLDAAGFTTANVDDAITEINSFRSTLGAHQNRLESTVNNLNTTVENLSSAESRIRDTDMASEMSEFNKQNILVQAATAMLAQPNQAPQSVLSLLQ